MNVIKSIQEKELLIGILARNGEEYGIMVDGILASKEDIMPYYKILNPEIIPESIRNEFVENIMIVIVGQYNNNYSEVTVEEFMHIMELIPISVYGGVVMGAIGGSIATGIVAVLLHTLSKRT